MTQLPKSTYYEILGVPESATLEMIKTAYSMRVKQTHPEKNINASAEKNIILVQEAYEILCNPIKRSNYDEQLSSIKEAFENSQAIKSNMSYDNTSKLKYFVNIGIIVVIHLAFTICGAFWGVFISYRLLGGFIVYHNDWAKEYSSPWILLSGAIWAIIGLCTPTSFVKRVYVLFKGMSPIQYIVLFISVELLSFPYVFLLKSICKIFGWLAP